MNTQPILSFIKNHNLPEKLKLNSDRISQLLLDNIAWEIGLGHSYEEAAEMACIVLNGEALDLHIASGWDDDDFYTIYEVQDELLEAIKEAYK